MKADFTSRSPGFRSARRTEIRIFIASCSIDAAGTGLYLTLYASFSTQIVGLSTWAAGLVFSIAGLIGVIGAVPIVTIADRIGPRLLQIYIYTIRATGYGIIGLVHTAWVFILLASLVGIFDRASGPVLQALVAEGFGGIDRTRAFSLLRSWRNVGFIAGALIGTTAFAARSELSYTFCILTNSASFLAAAAGFARLGPTWRNVSSRSADRAPSGLFKIFSHRKYIGIAGLHGILALHGSMLTFALPLWLIRHTSAPRWTIPLLIALNCCLAIVMQNRASKGSEDLKTARRLSIQAGLFLAFSCLLLVSAEHVPPSFPVALIACTVVLITFAEIWQAAAAVTLSLDLAPSGARGQYLAVFGFFLNGQGVAGPLALAICVGAGSLGMLLLALVFLATSATLAMVSVRPTPG